MRLRFLFVPLLFLASPAIAAKTVDPAVKAFIDSLDRQNKCMAHKEGTIPECLNRFPLIVTKRDHSNDVTPTHYDHDYEMDLDQIRQDYRNDIESIRNDASLRRAGLLPH